MSARLVFASLIALLPAAAFAQAVEKPITRAELPGLIREAIINDPEMIMEAVEKLRDKQGKESAEKARESIAKQKPAIYSDADSPSAGNPDGKVTVVEFFDYHCGYCKHVLPSITKLLEQDKDVRVIFKELPILSEDSVLAARAALAVHRLDKTKYFPFHSALMKANGKFNEAMLLKTAKDLGVDETKLKAEIGKQDISAALDKNRALADSLGIRGTPAIIINDELFPGAVPYEDLKKLVDYAHAGKKLVLEEPGAQK